MYEINDFLTMLLIVVDFFYLNVACKAENELVSGFTVCAKSWRVVPRGSFNASLFIVQGLGFVYIRLFCQMSKELSNTPLMSESHQGRIN